MPAPSLFARFIQGTACLLQCSSLSSNRGIASSYASPSTPPAHPVSEELMDMFTVKTDIRNNGITECVGVAWTNRPSP